MDIKNFLLQELRIHPDCDPQYKKVLKGTRFIFNTLDKSLSDDTISRKLFGQRVFIHTIVGKNGSGKSSILELIYRIINNYSYYILKGTRPKRVAAEPIYLIEGLSVDLEYVVDDKACTIFVRNKSLALIQRDKKVYFGEFHSDFESFEDYNQSKPQVIRDLASASFYTIVTNYSLQSLVNMDFKNEVVKEMATGKGTGITTNGNWLDSLFRKNDGYITPIVLNPYREDGILNLNREYYLTQSRISALLIETRNKRKQFLEGYQLATINYNNNIEHFLPKFFEKYNSADLSIHLSELLFAIREGRSIASFIIKEYNLFPKLEKEEDVIPYAYLVYKTLNVSSKYPQYEQFQNIPPLHSFDKVPSSLEQEDLKLVIQEILIDKSHVNTKIFQTLNYINLYDKHLEQLTLDSYKPYLNKAIYKDLNEIMEYLPPPYYIQEVMLLRVEENSTMRLSDLSSGERQFIYTVSTIIYHIKNLLSIQNTHRIRYRNINIILDELEICFHPEYQRKFIDQFLDLINRLNILRNCSINILIVTHSPFILSDIPKTNILYLERGEQLFDQNLVNPFAANLNDILYQSFFLSGGFMGEYAKNQINSAVKALMYKIDRGNLPKKSDWSKNTLKGLIDIIGEPLLKDNLLSLFHQAFDIISIEDQLRMKEEEIKSLKDQLKNQDKIN
ncbi:MULTISPECIES: AAA family ATPase [Sphingobacterium]|uniref:AAA family ATPase n=1 Tax=Sphingobacterium TaxID=28453 RepID=UPI00257E7324|nr:MULTISPECIES: AAA family ATPase [Sphingobacterium]